MAPVREVAFELECFEWAEERLEVAGRWKGLGPHRLNRPVLTLATEGGRRKRLVALPGGHMGVAGDTWRASFAWPGDPTEITGAELEVGGSLVVDLPLPDRRRRRRRRAVEEQADESLRAEAGALRAQVDRLRAELAGREREIIALHAQLDEATGDDEVPARAGADDRTVEIGGIAAEAERAEQAEQLTVEIRRLTGEVERLAEEKRAGAEEMGAEIRRLTLEVERLQAENAAAAEAATPELERLAAEREAAVAAERERWQTEVDELRGAFADAAAEAEDVRDRHRAELESLEAQLREERAQVARLSTQLGWKSEGPDPDEPGGPPTTPMPAPSEPEPGRIEAAVLDAPGPLRAGSRPASPPGVEDPAQPSPVFVEDEEESGDDKQRGAGSSAFQAMKARFEGLFATNGNSRHDEDPDETPAVPRPVRTAAAARARAGATVAARRSPGEVWAMRVLAAFLVAVLLTAFVLILASIA